MKAQTYRFLRIVFTLALVLLSLVLEAVLITVDAQGEAGLLVYPYLGETTTTSVVISWVTDSTGASEVRYSLDQSYSNVVAAADSTYDGKYWHSATITGLTADTTYYYKVYTGGDDVTPWSEITFTTAPEPTVPGFTLVALGDSRPDAASSPPSQGALDVAAQMGQHSFDLAIHTGDIVHSGGICSGSDSSWNQYIRVYFDLYQESMGDTPFYPSVGNHELSGDSCGYQSYTDVYYLPENAPSGDEEEYYSFDWGNAHFVALDTNQSHSIGSSQYNWLVNDLQTSAQPWKFVFFHHPAYSSGYHGITSEVPTHLVSVFETYGVDVVFAGHDHHYERTCSILNGACTTPQDGGVVYYVTGGGGAPLYPAIGDWFTAYHDSLNHFLKVEVNDCRLRLDAIDTNGSVFDTYEIDYCSVNEAPVVGDIPDQTITEGETFTTINLDDYVSDVDNTDAEMTWAYSGNSELSVTIVDRVATIGIPDPDWNGSETITFTATDPGLLSDSDDAAFTVTPVNDPPVANDDAYSVNEGDTLSVAAPGVLANDTDADAGDTLTVTLVSSPSHGALTLNTDGSFIYAHDGSETVSDHFTYKANDGTADSSVATVTITVNPVNDPPVAANDSATTDENKSVNINVLTNDSDPEDDTLTVSDYDTSSTEGGTVSCTSTGVCTYSPPADFNGTDTFTYTASDGNGGFATATVTVAVIAAASPENFIYLPLIWRD